MAQKPERQPYINFIRSNNNLAGFNQKESSTSDAPCQDASEVYKSIVLSKPSSSKSTNQYCEQPVIRRKSANAQSTHHNNKPTYKPNDIFTFCQNGKLKECGQWLKCGFDVNQRDSYHWTPLMVASCSGHFEIVKLLLESGADCSLTCHKGKSALDLARKSRHNKVVKLFTDYINPVDVEERHTKPENSDIDNFCEQPQSSQEEKPEPFECSSCGLVTDSDLASHESSISHQLKSGQFSSEQTRAMGNFSHINRNFKGYQLLLKEGWNGFTGMGKNEKGRRYPILPIKKHNRACIGLPQTEQTKAIELVDKRTTKAQN